MSKDQKLTKNQNVEIVDKLEKERDKLKIKIEKLDRFIDSNENNVTSKHYMLLVSQYHIMQRYRIILDLRIEDLKKPRSTFSWDNVWTK